MIHYTDKLVLIDEDTLKSLLSVSDELFGLVTHCVNQDEFEPLKASKLSLKGRYANLREQL